MGEGKHWVDGQVLRASDLADFRQTCIRLDVNENIFIHILKFHCEHVLAGLQCWKWNLLKAHGQDPGNGSLIVTSLRWDGDAALKLMTRADELEAIMAYGPAYNNRQICDYP